LLNSKWMPPPTRDRPASAAAAEKLSEWRVGPPGTTVRSKGIASLQKKPVRTAAADALNELWPDQCSGEPPTVPARADQAGSPSVLGLGSRSPSRMAVVGRQKRTLNFVKYVGATVSAIAMLPRAKRAAVPARRADRLAP